MSITIAPAKTPLSDSAIPFSKGDSVCFVILFISGHEREAAKLREIRRYIN